MVPGRTFPHVQMELHLAHRGRCTCPSCRRLTSWLTASPSCTQTQTCHLLLFESTWQKYQWWNLWSITAWRFSEHLFSDVTILVDVVKVESPVELFSDRSSQQHGQTDHKVLPMRAAESGQRLDNEEIKIEGNKETLWVKRFSPQNEWSHFCQDQMR